MSEPFEPRVIVVGAAVAGSAVANAFGQMGIPTRVLEKGAERDNSTRGDVLHPPTLRFLEQWGVLGPMHEDGTLPITQIAVTHRELGRLATYDIPPQGEGPAGRSVAVPHDRIEAVMKACAERWPSVRMERTAVRGAIVENGRVVGVRTESGGVQREYRAPLVVACDGSQSLLRREVGIAVDRHPYDHELVYIAAEGETDPPAAMHFFLDDRGVIMVANRPRNRMRIAIAFKHGERGDLLKRPDPGVYDYVVSRVPALASARFGREHVHVYPLARQVAERFAFPGLALVGDAAHTTHPAGATGMNLAISGGARLAELLGPAITSGTLDPAEIDAALERYTADRRPAAAAAVEQNHQQALRIWTNDCHLDPHAYAGAADPNASWGVGGAGWGRDPAALAYAGRTED